MKSELFAPPSMGGLYETQPQPPESASVAENLAIDERTMGWSTRVGFEPYRVNQTLGFAPFTVGRIDSLFVFRELADASRNVILFESAGTLYLLKEVGGTVTLTTIRSGRSIPSVSSVPTQYTQVAGGVLLTNGRDAPLFVRPWPLASAVNLSSLARDWGVPRPVAPSPYRVDPTHQGTPSDGSGSASVSLWVAQHTRSSPQWTVDQFGIGFAKDIGGDPVTSRYSHQISFVSDTGSEGPLSATSTKAWETKGNNRYRYAMVLQIPTGPPGTLARRLYRSRNYSDDTNIENQSERYHVLDIPNNGEEYVVDGYQQAGLGALAPTDLIDFPSARARFAASWADRCWMDGGLDDARTLYYSDAGLPEQFSLGGYITLSGDGGNITGLRSHYGALVVFRETGLDVVSAIDPNLGQWASRPLSTEMQCVAPMTADHVPGVGLVFAAVDGIYALSGGGEGGSSFEFTRITTNLSETWGRVTRECLPRAVGRYCPATREYHVYVPADGIDRPWLGLVWHVDKMVWSTRKGFPVGALDRLPTGELVFGSNGNASHPGIFVMSGRRTLGRKQEGETFVDVGPPTSTWKSPWLQVTSPQDKKQVQYVTMWVMSTGSVNVSVRVYKDWQRTSYLERAFLAQPADATNLPVLDTVLLNGGEAWEQTQAVPLRIPVAHQSCSWFAFEVSTTDDLVLVGWSIEYQLRGTITVEGKRA